MERIVDIFGYSALYGDMYSSDTSWFGRVLLGEDNKFEGVVEDYDRTTHFLVFGEMTDKDINLIKCSKKDFNMPYLFSVSKDKVGFYGDYFVKDLYNKIPLGECKLSVLPSEVTREETDFEKREIRRGIDILKNDLGERGKDLLNDFDKNRKPNTIVKIKNNKTV